MSYLQAAVLVNMYNYPCESDRYGQNCSARLVQVAAAQEFRQAQRIVQEGTTWEQNWQECALRRTCIRSCVGLGGWQAEHKAIEHEFIALGLYMCPDGELPPL